VEAKAKQTAAASSMGGPAKSSMSPAPPSGPPVPKGDGKDLERLGMGMKRLGFGSVPAPPTASSKGHAEDAPTTARDKFGNQKSISSDMYFGRGSYDPVAHAEAQTRLQSFQGATSISSNQYFGREEEDEMGQPGSPSAYLGDGALANYEAVARDAISRVMANPDVQNLGDNIRQGALKLSDYLATMSDR